MTKKSVMTISERTSRTVMSAPCFSAAARAAATGKRAFRPRHEAPASRPSRRLEVLPHQQRDVREPGPLRHHDNAPHAEEAVEALRRRPRLLSLRDDLRRRMPELRRVLRGDDAE